MTEVTFDSAQSRGSVADPGRDAARGSPSPRPEECGIEPDTYESESMREMQRLVLQDVILRLIRDMGGNETAAARAMGVEVETLKVWLAE